MASRFTTSCHECGFHLDDSCNFCPSCGTEVVNDDERSLIEYYFFRGYTYESIVKLLSKQHGIQIGERTLKYRLQSYGLRRRCPVYDLAQVRQRVAEELDGPGCMGGYRSVWHTLRLEGLQVPREVVATVVRELDPVGCELRRSKRLKRRKYSSPGPNYCWHTDGYDKLKPFGFPIHGCIDGWSRRIMWLQVARSNNNPEIPAENFLQCVTECGGCPVKVRSDCGTENGILAAIQCEFRGTADAHVFGSSPANQRIEGWWSFYRRNRSTWWINYFKDLIEKDAFHPGNQLEEEALWYCFSGILQKDLDLVREHWNTHRIRDSKHDTVPGRPDELFLLPECSGGIDGLLLPISTDQLRFVSDNLFQSDEEINEFQEYFDYIMANSNFSMPSNWREAEWLYLQLIAIATQ